MVTAIEVPADKLILRLAKYRKENVDEVRAPEWSYFVKTGVNRENPPIQEDWWYIRAASIMRKMYKTKTPIGIETYRVIYDGRKNRGSRPEHFVKASGAIPRTIPKQLEKAGLVARVPGKGRILTPKAVSLLDKIAFEIMSEISKENPEIQKYLQ